jgi:hypothetical protein
MKATQVLRGSPKQQKELTMPEDIVILPILFSLFGFVAWIIFTTVRRYKTAKLQAEVQTKLLEKFGSGQELLMSRAMRGSDSWSRSRWNKGRLMGGFWERRRLASSLCYSDLRSCFCAVEYPAPKRDSWCRAQLLSAWASASDCQRPCPTSCRSRLDC